MATTAWELRPAEFWSLHPTELWWMADARRPKKDYGSMSEHEVAELHKEMVDMGMLPGGH